MGPRARRRFAWLVATVAVLAVVGAMIHFFGSADNMSSKVAASEPQQASGEVSGGIPFGASSQQVVGTFGPPTRNGAGCSVYSANAHRINGEYLGKFVDGLKFCFSDGPAGGKVVSTIYNHLIAHPTPADKHFAGGWEPAVAIGMGSGSSP
jgi:hypothetical protein